MARGWSKFRLLLWKNWVLQKRHPIQTAVEILIPIIFVSFLCVIRGIIKPKIYDEPILTSPYSPMDLSGTVIPFLGLQNMVLNRSATMKPRIIYAPKNSMVDIIMDEASSKLRLIAEGVKSESELLHKFDIMTDYERAMSLAGIVFESMTQDDKKFPSEIKIKFRFPSELRYKSPNTSLESWNTARLFPSFQGRNPRNIIINDTLTDPGYHEEGFLALQNSISSSVLQYLQPKLSIPEIQLQKFPYPPFIDDPLLRGLQQALALIIVLGFSYTCFNTVKAIATDKELQLKESMKIMGLPNHLHWCAWFVKTYLFLAISIIIMVVLLTANWYPDTDISVISKSDWTVILVFFLVYAVTVICFCFMMSTFFGKANTAAAISGIIFILSYVPYTFLITMYQSWSKEAKLATGLGLNTALALGLQIILMYEGSGDGLQWSTVWESSSVDDNIKFGYVLIVLICDAVLYLFVALYSEAVFPGKYGVPKPWYFLFQWSYWCGKSRRQHNIKNITNVELQDASAFEDNPNLKIGIKIKNLKKVYKNKTAVRNLSMNMYEDQITVLLGHNGAGKTTTINMLIGMITPTSGTATLDDFDINENMEILRDNLGFCPQHNILFKELTVEEHIYFFAKLKGLNNVETKEEIINFTRALELEDKTNKQACTLSGGMKRKLSAALALCGNSKIVIFDEPTAGMDPAARRTFWNLLLSNKSGRTILLTTHFMDEADLLGDRIAIISGGQLQCCGSSFFLKKKYGVGYHLIVVKGPACHVDSVTNLLQRHIPDICLYHNVASELTYLLEENKSSLFEAMLKELEENLDFLDIISFGISITTMEEVFMKNCEISDTNNYGQFKDTLFDLPTEETMRYSSKFRNYSAFTSDLQLVSGMKLYIYQAYAILIKHVFCTISAWIMLFFQVTAPVFCLSFYFLHIQQLNVIRQQEPNLNFSIETYGPDTFTPLELLTNKSNTRKYFMQYKDIMTPNNIVDITTGSASSYMTQFMLQVSEDKDAFKTFREKYIVGATFDKSVSNVTSLITAWYNDQPFHSSPLSLNIVYNSIIKNLNYSFAISNHPLPANLKSQMMNSADLIDSTFNVTFTFTIFLSFVSSLFVMFHLKERVFKSKHLQFVSGVNSIIYWSVSYVWDFLAYILIFIFIIGTLAVFQREGYSSPEQLGEKNIRRLAQIISLVSKICFAFQSFMQFRWSAGKVENRIVTTGFSQNNCD